MLKRLNLWLQALPQPLACRNIMQKGTGVYNRYASHFMSLLQIQLTARSGCYSCSDHASPGFDMLQVLTSANWGGKVGNFFTGGLNLQIEHHLFPAISFVHYPAIAKIVRDECEKRDIPYAHYDTLPSIVGRFSRCGSKLRLLLCHHSPVCHAVFQYGITA